MTTRSWAAHPRQASALTAQIGEADAEWAFSIAASDVAALAPELRTADGRLNPDAFSDLIAVFHYKVA